MPVSSETKKPEGNMPDQEVVDNYYLLKTMDESGLLMHFVKRGIIPITYLDYKTIYERYLDFREEYAITESYHSTAVVCNVSYGTVRKVVKLMRS